MKRSTRIALTGGGTAGHVTPILAILDELRARGSQLLYIGSYTGIERTLASEAGLDYKPISTGKLRRHLSFKNFLDLFRVLLGFIQSLIVLIKFKPDFIFSKGGFVSVPVCLAAYCLRIPICTHESDMTPGLATKIISRIARKVLCNFEPSLKFLPKSKTICIGLPLREQLFKGNRDAGYIFANFDKADPRPLILVIGGSSGAQFINELIENSLESLLAQYKIVHIVGPKNQASQIYPQKNYLRLPYVKEELADLFAASDVVISRAGATTICELAALQKPMILIPLERGSRGDQILNAKYFEEKGLAINLPETKLSTAALEVALSAALHGKQGQKPTIFDSKTLNKKFVDQLWELLAT